MTKMKYIMKEKGIVDDNTLEITCPYCKAAALSNADMTEIISPMHHDDHCLFVKTCRDLKVNPHDYNDERVKRVLEVKKLF